MNLKKIFCNLGIYLVCFTLYINTLTRANAEIIDDLNTHEFIKSIYINKNKIECKYHLIMLFASWCSHCKKSVPEILKLQAKYGENLNVVLFSLDEDNSKFYNFANRINNLNLGGNVNVYRMNSPDDILGVFEFFNIKYKDKIPHFVLLRNNEKSPIMDGGVSVAKVGKYLEAQLETSGMN